MLPRIDEELQLDGCHCHQLFENYQKKEEKSLDDQAFKTYQVARNHFIAALKASYIHRRKSDFFDSIEIRQTGLELLSVLDHDTRFNFRVLLKTQTTMPFHKATDILNDATNLLNELLKLQHGSKDTQKAAIASSSLERKINQYPMEKSKLCMAGGLFLLSSALVILGVVTLSVVTGGAFASVALTAYLSMHSAVAMGLFAFSPITLCAGVSLFRQANDLTPRKEVKNFVNANQREIKKISQPEKEDKSILQATFAQINRI